MMLTLAELGITMVAHSPRGHGVLHRISDTPLAGLLAEVAGAYDVTPGQPPLRQCGFCSTQHRRE